MIISRTPFRITFFGGGTDFPEFYRRHGGATLSATVNKYCYISLHALSQFFEHRYRASYARTELVQRPEQFEHPLIRECLRHMKIRTGVEVSHVADLPGRTGLGSSSSFTVGLLNALYAFQNRSHVATRPRLAKEAIHVERERVGDAGGHQDQYAAAYGGVLRVDYRRNGTIRARHLALSESRRHTFERHLLLFYTGIYKSAQTIAKRQRGQIGKKLQTLREMRGMVDTAQKILTGTGPVHEFGLMLHETWQRKKTLARGISNPTIDHAYNAARKAGALGGKLLGTGGRGFLLFFAEPDAHARIRRALTDLQEVDFKISDGGSEVVFRSGE